MGLYDRDYMRRPPEPRRGRSTAAVGGLRSRRMRIVLAVIAAFVAAAFLARLI